MIDCKNFPWRWTLNFWLNGCSAADDKQHRDLLSKWSEVGTNFNCWLTALPLCCLRHGPWNWKEQSSLFPPFDLYKKQPLQCNVTILWNKIKVIASLALVEHLCKHVYARSTFLPLYSLIQQNTVTSWISAKKRVSNCCRVNDRIHPRRCRHRQLQITFK